jgi:hypothetical protein
MIGPSRIHDTAPAMLKVRLNPIQCVAHGLCGELLPERVSRVREVLDAREAYGQYVDCPISFDARDSVATFGIPRLRNILCNGERFPWR